MIKIKIFKSYLYLESNYLTLLLWLSFFLCHVEHYFYLVHIHFHLYKNIITTLLTLLSLLLSLYLVSFLD